MVQAKFNKTKPRKISIYYYWKEISNDLSFCLNRSEIKRIHEVVLLRITIGKKSNFKKKIASKWFYQ